MFSPLCREMDAFCPVNKTTAIYQELGTVLDHQLTGVCQAQISPELPQQFQGVNLRPWSPSSNLLKFTIISNVTAQILPLTQNEELPRDVEQIVSWTLSWKHPWSSLHMLHFFPSWKRDFLQAMQTSEFSMWFQSSMQLFSCHIHRHCF